MTIPALPRGAGCVSTDAQRQKRAVAEYLAALEAEAQADEEGGAAAAVPTERPASRRMSFWRSLGTLP